jgi:protein-disulfide isomerase
LLLFGAGLASGGLPPLVEGNAQSEARVVIYEDLQCSDCAAFRTMIDQHLLPRFGARVAFEHRDFPLPKHDWARRAAIAGRHFQSISVELAVEWRRETLANMRSIKAESFDQWLRGFASRRKQDPDRAVAALADPALAEAVEKEFQEGVARGIAKTPTALVNGEPFIETFTLDQISKGIERAIKEAGIQ